MLASLALGDLSRSGGWLGRLLYGMTVSWSSLHVPLSSFTITPSVCWKKYVGKILQLCLFFCTHWCNFLLGFFFHLLMAKSHWPAHGMAQICFCAVGGEENQECRADVKALGNRSPTSLLAQAASSCKPTLGFHCCYCL